MAMRRRSFLSLGAVAAMSAGLSACNANSDKEAGGGSGAAVTLQFQQWWEPELPKGSLRSLMDEFENANPGINVELLSAPYADTQQQITAGAASGTMADVVGLDGAWVNDLQKQNAIVNLSEIMKQNNYDPSQLSDTIKLKGSTYAIPVTNFIYPLFVNKDLLSKADVSSILTKRTDFATAAQAVTKLGGGIYGWVLPLGTTTANGIQNDVMSWVWASGGSMLNNGEPNLVNNAEIKSVLTFIKDMYDKSSIMPGAFNLQEQDKVTNFTNGRVGMMIDSLAHVTQIKQSNANIKFDVAAVPSSDAGATGKPGICYAAWGIGIASNSKNQTAAWKLVAFLLDATNNGKLCDLAHAFPNNKKANLTFTNSDPIFQKAFALYKDAKPTNEFYGLPQATTLFRDFDQELQKTLDGKQSIDTCLTNIQGKWKAIF